LVLARLVIVRGDNPEKTPSSTAVHSGSGAIRIPSR
jgi:hypothetical protein